MPFFKSIKAIARLGLVAAFSIAAIHAAGAKGGKTLRVGTSVDIASLDPTQTRVLTDFEVIKHVLQTLVTTDDGAGPAPMLAQSWSVSSDGLTWRFNLRKGVKFHDGTPFNAEAVKFNLDRFSDPKNGTLFKSLLKMVDSVTVINDHTVDIRTKYRFSPLLLHLAYPATAISSPSAVKKYGADYRSHPVGTGPFKFSERRPGEYTELVASDDYWGAKAGVQRLRYIPIIDSATRIAALEAGNIDVAVRIPYHEVGRIQKNTALNVVQTQSSRIMFMPINVAKPALADVRVREALNYAVDKKAIASSILFNNGRPMDAIVGPGAFGYSHVMEYPYDPKKAKVLLAEAGAKDLTLDLFYSPGRYTGDGEVAEAVVAYLEAVGVKVNLNRMEWATYLQAVRKGSAGKTHDLALYGWGWASGDADQGLSALFGKGSANNSSHYSPDKVQSLLAAQASETDPSKRLALIKRLSEIAMKDAPWIFLVSQGLVTASQKNVEGIVIPANEMLNFYHAHFK